MKRMDTSINGVRGPELVPGKGCQAPSTSNTRHQLPDTRYVVPGTRYFRRDYWHQVPGTRYQKHCSWYQVPGTKYLAPRHM